MDEKELAEQKALHEWMVGFVARCEKQEREAPAKREALLRHLARLDVKHAERLGRNHKTGERL